MRKSAFFCAILFLLFSFTGKHYPAPGKWVSLFDGKSLANWKVGANAETFSVDSGMIIVHGKTAHLFYDGNVQDHNSKQM
jgi:hypothetical protein